MKQSYFKSIKLNSIQFYAFILLHYLYFYINRDYQINIFSQHILLIIYKNMQSNQNYSFNQFTDLKILCTKENNASFICFSKQCKNIAFVCDDKNCQCRIVHASCMNGELDNFIKNILKKSLSLSPVCKKVEEMFEKAIDQLSQMRDHLLVQIKQKYEFQGLSQDQLKFINSLKNQKPNEISCQFAWNIIVNLYQKQQNLKTQKQMKSDIELLWNKFDSEIKELDTSILKYFKNINQSKNLFEQSKIIKNWKESQILISFFNKKIKSAELLYRASQNQFSIQKFHQKCDNVENTVVLCETNFNKIIGGYPSVKWQSTNQWLTSSQKSSFLFSITNGQKLIYNTGSQIYCHPGYGPAFGSDHDLYFCDKSNQNGGSYANIGSSYYHKDYPNSSKESWKRFSGGQNYHFTTKQWQVWKIIFE